ncbi:glycine--tRNA ligase subunit beta [Geotalea sp. SG265]|uniref:glycine--tRNA ligase subunit beta n=1 Tax=Geotalea sp. SG265 TaxID=2922867 RepID=UPI001FAFECE3|nr:glycine--tRNA ligase subunit beta [Geotalea sp. SG265]
MAKELFLEIGTEEIPAGFLPKAMADMEGLIRKELETARIGFGEVRTMATPRRLVLVVKDVAEQQTDAEITTMGPARKVAFNADGTPTKAGEGFARGQGVDASALAIVATEKGDYVAVTKKEIGVATAGLLVEILPRLINAIPFKKSMRWGDQDVRFARPMHWIVALFDGTVVPFVFGNIQSGSMSRGHRFMANAPFPVRDFGHYLEECERHFVIPDPEKRKEIIRREIERVAKAAGGNVLPDEGLLEQVTYLVEYPSAVHGTFSADFLAVPREVLITSMREHQRYFSLVDGAGKLMPGFITINNTLTEDPTVVVKGNERVLRARLSDARFFFEEDKKVPLEKRVEALKSIVYQAKLGTSYEKMERFKQLAKWLAHKRDALFIDKVGRAAKLCKADLVTGMVGEFPEVQGIMGREYALHDGEDAEVANAIAEHYLPIQAGGELPASDIGAFLSLADKMDTICGCFGVGLVPTGSADPYALRRSALGIINIIIEKKYNDSLSEFIRAAINLLQTKLTRDEGDVYRDVLEFFKGRFVNLMMDRFPADVVEAVVAVSFDNLVQTTSRIRALSEFKNRPDFEPFAAAFKRVSNIVKGPVVVIGVSEDAFEDKAEGQLYSAYLSIRNGINENIAAGNYLEALTQISTLKVAVDEFFDKVMVMAEDEKVRNNRLALLHEIKSLFRDIADFAKLTA